MDIRICVGSSCHIKGSPEIIALLQKGIEEHGLSDDVTLSGSFCVGQCNRTGVTVLVDEAVHVGITRENFNEFFKENILKKLK